MLNHPSTADFLDPSGTYLNHILASKKRRLSEELSQIPHLKMEALAFETAKAHDQVKVCPALPFQGALLSTKDSFPAIIGELKKKSPSKGLLRPSFNAHELGQAYTNAGVEALSILTEMDYFEGHPNYIQQVRAVTNLPILRKDFIFNAYDVLKTRVLGADALLLIAAILSPQQLKSLIELAHLLKLECLVEIHNQIDLDKALEANATLIGINNRNLKTFEVDLGTTEVLAPLIPSDKIIISESGINCTADLHRMKEAGVHAVLCGEVFMRAPCVEDAVRRLRP